MKKTGLTTGDVAAYCHVTSTTVINWITQGKLKAYQTPGGHYRIHREDFKMFLKDYGIPLRADFFLEEKRKILVVDDEPGIIELIIKILRYHFPGFVVATAGDGYEAGVQVVTFAPDMIILDLLMPHIDGFEVCRKVKASPRTSNVKILIITAHPENQNIERALACGADDYLLKPFTVEELVEKVSALLIGENHDNSEKAG